MGLHREVIQRKDAKKEINHGGDERSSLHLEKIVVCCSDNAMSVSPKLHLSFLSTQLSADEFASFALRKGDSVTVSVSPCL